MSPCALVLLLAAAPPRQAADSSLRADLLLIRELQRLTDEHGDAIWPGFDVSLLPIAVNEDDRRELLLHHPHPSSDYRPLEGVEPDFAGALVRDGCSRYGPRGGGWAVELLGEWTAYVSIPEPKEDVEEWLSVVLHECFHVYQHRILTKPFAGPAPAEPPLLDARNSARLGLEGRVLAAAFSGAAPAAERLRALAEMFVTVRGERRAALAPGVALQEDLSEWNEGSATYSQVRLLERLEEAGGIEPAGAPGYAGFTDAAERRKKMLAAITPPAGLIPFMHAQYQHGMAECLLLDRLRPGWKQELADKGVPLFEMLKRAVPLDDELRRRRLAQAEKEFRFDELLADQTRCVEERTKLLRGFLEGPGRRYRIFHGELAGSFNWKPRGPVYEVPDDLLPKEFVAATRRNGVMIVVGGAPATIWGGGFEAFDRGDLHFKSKEVPITFTQSFFEWIDRDPKANGSDLRIESAEERQGVRLKVHVATDGFELDAAAARIVAGADVVEIHPVAPTPAK
jgi:hypothetical protein